MKSILITGGCGYIGSRVAILLANKGLPVIVVDKINPKERGIIFPKSVEFRESCLGAHVNTRRTIRGVGVVLHFAADIGPLTYMHERQADIIRKNLAIDSALYPALIEEDADAIVYASSSMVFQRAAKYPYHEHDLVHIQPPTNVYGFSKLAGEYFCRAFNRQYGLPFVIMRYHNVYGPGEDSKGSTPGDIHVIPALTEKVLDGQYPLEFLGSTTATRPFTFIDDAVDATVRLVELTLGGDKKVLNNDFNIGPNEATKIVHLGEKIWNLLGDGRPFQYIVKKTEAITAERREMDASKIISVTGWRPKVALDEGIMKTAEWIKSRKK